MSDDSILTVFIQTTVAAAALPPVLVSTEPFSVTDLLLHLLHIMVKLSSLPGNSDTPLLLRAKSLQQMQGVGEESDFNLVAILARVFRELITGNASCQQIFGDVS